MMMARIRRQREQGFTLIEVLLAAGLFSVIALSIYMVFAQGLNVEKRLRGKSSAAAAIFETVFRLAGDLEQMVPYTFPGTDRMFFDGQHHAIAFVQAQPDGLTEIRYLLEESENGSVHRVEVGETVESMHAATVVSRTEDAVQTWSLVRVPRPLLWSVKDDAGETKDILSRQVVEEGLEFFYLGLDDNGEQVWKTEWQEGSWPLAVRVHLTLLDGNETVEFVRDIFTGATSLESAGVYEDK